MVGALLVGVSGQAAFGQAKEGGLALEDIVVTAQKRTQSLQDVPVSVSVVTGDALREAGVSTLERIAASSPTLRISNTNTGYVGIRGLGSSENPGFEQSVATFVDGVYRPRVGQLRSGLFDIERVEILAGPQSTFFGANAIAGAINITSKKPTKDYSGYVSGLFDPTTNEYNLEGAAGGPIAGDRLLGRLSLRVSGMDGYYLNSKTGSHEPHNRDFQGRLSLHWTPVDIVTVEARLDYIRRRDKGTNNYELLNCPPAGGAANGLCLTAVNRFGGVLDDDLNWKGSHGPSFNNQDYWEGAITTTVELGRNTLTSVSAIADQRQDSLFDSAAVPQNSVVNTLHNIAVANPEKYQQYSQELRFATPDEERLSFMIGGYYEHNKLILKNNFGFFFLPLGGLLPPLAGVSATTPIAARARLVQSSDHYSVFGSADYKLTDQLTLAIGARYSSIHKTGHRSARMGVSDAFLTSFDPLPALQNQSAATATAVALGDFPQTSRTDDKFIPSVNIRYQPSNDLMLYGKYSKGFKAGGFDGLITDNTYGPEKVDAFEIGLKSSFLDRRGTIDIAVFTSNYDDLQEGAIIQPCPSCAPSARIRNVGKVRARGMEFSSQFRATEWLQLFAGGSYLDSKYRKFPNAACTALQSAQFVATPARPFCIQDLAGRTRPFAPKWRFNAGADFKAPISSEVDFKLGADFFYSTSFFMASTLDPLLHQDDYAKLDMRIALAAADGNWEAAVIVRNVTDSITKSWAIILPTTQRTVQGIADPPRTVGLQLTYKW